MSRYYITLPISRQIFSFLFPLIEPVDNVDNATSASSVLPTRPTADPKVAFLARPIFEPAAMEVHTFPKWSVIDEYCEDFPHFFEQVRRDCFITLATSFIVYVSALDRDRSLGVKTNDPVSQ